MHKANPARRAPTCRSCGAGLHTTFVDLGPSPLSNRFLAAESLAAMEPFFPLHVYVCDTCLLVQLEEFESPDDIFSDDYAYFSSFSTSWLEHAKEFATQATARFGLNARSKVVEVASNDGYLLQYFHAEGIPVLGIEPASNVAAAAQEKGIPTLTRFFGKALAQELKQQGHAADLVAANNVLAHVPDINDFVAGLAHVLKPTGVVSLEFPHLLNLIEQRQFDTIYHEHFSYLSFGVVREILKRHGLQVFDVERLPTHGGSLRVWACLASAPRPARPGIHQVQATEEAGGLSRLATYTTYAARVAQVKGNLLSFLIQAQRERKLVVGYGAPAKATTLLNHCGIRPDLLAFTVDRSPHKQGRYIPGVRIPILAPDQILERRPDYVLILPWNLRDEIMDQMAAVRSWGGQFVVPIPDCQVLP
ncbi:MAG: methyltransferase domain-containing protein [Thermoplasmatota archaeon]